MSSENLSAWLDLVPAAVAQQTQDLAARIDVMRKTEIIYPAQQNIFAALKACGPQDVRVVVLGQDPYHEPGQAMGLSFSVPQGCKLPPSLRNIYKELAADLGCVQPTSGDLTSWAHGGVLLLNTTLTVRQGEANSHAKLGWGSFTGAVVEACLALPGPIVFLCWGKNAINLVEGAMQKGCSANKFVLKSTHPSPLSASRATADLLAFLGSRPFSKSNELLVSAGAKPIDWECLVAQKPLF